MFAENPWTYERQWKEAQESVWSWSATPGPKLFHSGFSRYHLYHKRQSFKVLQSDLKHLGFSFPRVSRWQRKGLESRGKTISFWFQSCSCLVMKPYMCGRLELTATQQYGQSWSCSLFWESRMANRKQKSREGKFKEAVPHIKCKQVLPFNQKIPSSVPARSFLAPYIGSWSSGF